MKKKVTLLLLLASLGSAVAWAQTSVPSKPLNLSLPPGFDVPAASATSPAPPSNPSANAQAGAGNTATAGTKTVKPSDNPANNVATGPAPGVYYGDHSNQTANAFDASRPNCDDATYNNTQVHGSLDTGVVGGSHFSGSYGGGTVDFIKPTGSCEHPTGGIGISIGVEQGQFHGRGF